MLGYLIRLTCIGLWRLQSNTGLSLDYCLELSKYICTCQRWSKVWSYYNILTIHPCNANDLKQGHNEE